MKKMAKIIACALVAVAATCSVAAMSACSESGEEGYKTLNLEGVEATVANVASGDYQLQRPFNIVYNTSATLSDLATDFINYIFSTDGQQVVSDNGYITADTKSYTTSSPSGSLTITGSTSVTPLMQKLVAAYVKVNTSVSESNITITGTGSGSGITDAINNTVDFAMSSRDLKDSETAQGVAQYTIATDGIALIVNSGCSVTNVTISELYSLYVNGTAIQSTIVAGVSRESGSGTRSAFEELIGMGSDDTLYSGNGFDEYSTTQAVISAITTNTAANVIGYVSLGSVL